MFLLELLLYLSTTLWDNSFLWLFINWTRFCYLLNFLVLSLHLHLQLLSRRKLLLKLRAATLKVMLHLPRLVRRMIVQLGGMSVLDLLLGLVWFAWEFFFDEKLFQFHVFFFHLIFFVLGLIWYEPGLFFVFILCFYFYMYVMIVLHILKDLKNISCEYK